jgi:hypothetical protein
VKIYHWSDKHGLHWEFDWSLDSVGLVAAWLFYNWPRYTQISA